MRRLVESLLGKDNCVNLELSQMNEQFGVANLYGKRSGGSSDMSHLSVSDANLFKQVTGGDRLLANIKYRQQFSFTYNGVLWFCMNELPRFSGGDKNSVYNRMLIVECPNAIPAEDQDKHLDEKLHAERNGITQKAVKGLQELIQNGGLSVPKSVKKAKERYIQSNDTVISFFKTCMCPRDDAKASTADVSTSVVIAVYHAWCGYNNSGYGSTDREFRDSLSMYFGLPYDQLIKRVGGYSRFKDYTLTTEAAMRFSNVINKASNKNI